MIPADTNLERKLKELRKDKKMLKIAAMTDEGLNGAANKEGAVIRATVG